MKKSICIIVIAGALMAGCARKETSSGMEALPIEVARPMVKDVTLTRDYPGYLTAETTIDRATNEVIATTGLASIHFTERL